MDIGKLLLALYLATVITLSIGSVILLVLLIIWSLLNLPYWGTLIIIALVMIVALTIYFYFN